MGFTLFTLMFSLVFITIISPSVMSENGFGTKNTFYFLGGFQAITCITLGLFMKETKGLTREQKLNLYKPKNNEGLK